MLTTFIMKWQPVRKRRKIGLALLEAEKAAQLKALSEKIELKPEIKIETSKETKPSGADDFVFMLQGTEIARAKDLKELLNVTRSIPRKSIVYHIDNGDLSKWFYSLGHKELAENVRSIKGGKKHVIKQFIKTCNSALQEQQI